MNEQAFVVPALAGFSALRRYYKHVKPRRKEHYGATGGSNMRPKWAATQAANIGGL